MKKHALCLLSGGPDSFVLIDFLLKNDIEVSCLYVNYGQTSANLEYEAFLKICRFENVKWFHKIEIRNFGENIDTGLTNPDIIDPFFPSRNLLLITVASAFLSQLNSNYIAIGVIRSTNEYPDCKRSYFDILESIISKSIKKDINILTPLDDFTKIDIMRYFEKYQLPLKISYSCEKGVNNHCQICPSCVERIEVLKWLKTQH